MQQKIFSRSECFGSRQAMPFRFHQRKTAKTFPLLKAQHLFVDFSSAGLNAL